jgi:hypothetical protein
LSIGFSLERETKLELNLRAWIGLGMADSTYIFMGGNSPGSEVSS